MNEQLCLDARDEALTAINEREAVCALVDGDPVHARDRAAVIGAVREAARLNGDRISRNDIAPLIPAWVFPNVVGAVISALRSKRVLTWAEKRWATSDDINGGNAGKLCRIYEFHRDRLIETVATPQKTAAFIQEPML